MQLGLAALVFDRKGSFAIGAGREFDQIGHAGQVQSLRGQRQRQDPTDAARLAAAALVGHGMQHIALGRKSVLGPDPFKVDQRRLPQAIDRMLQGRDRDRLVGLSAAHSRSRISTPSGRPSRSIRTV